jgi:hypothetical protein
MKVKSDIRAGMSFEECDTQRNYYKSLVQSGRCVPNPNPPGPYPPNPYPPNPYPPNPSGGGYVNGVWYSDRSGWC